MSSRSNNTLSGPGQSAFAATPIVDRRRHDLDALRAFAMLLGIVLHAALSYMSAPWIVSDQSSSAGFDVMVAAIHGFRMPLFFLLSGFFSAMLLRRRGVSGLIGHRARRIGLPLLLGMVTIVPLLWGVMLGGWALAAAVPAPARETGGIWAAAAAGDLPAVRRCVEAGEPVDALDARFGMTPTAWAASGDYADVVSYLLDAGADPNARMGDGHRAMHTAAFFGSAESAAVLLDAGADPGVRNMHGETPADSASHDRRTTAFIAGLLGVPIEFEEVEGGRRAIVERLGSSTIGAETAQPPRASGVERSGTLRGVLVEFPLFHHLWFLWHLCWFILGLVAVTLAARRLRLGEMPAVLIATPFCLVWLVPLSAVTQSWQPAFGPDTSTGLVPMPHVLAHYAVFFGFGVLMHGCRGAADRLGRRWWVHLLLAAGTFCAALPLSRDAAVFARWGVSAELGGPACAVLQAVYTWAAIFGLMGLARRLLSRPDARVRFVSDSSYWLYLAHLPLVIAGQFALSYVALPGIVEFSLLAGVTIAVLLLGYRLWVRYTWLGMLLNGARTCPDRARTRAAGATAVAREAAPTSPASWRRGRGCPQPSGRR